MGLRRRSPQSLHRPPPVSGAEGPKGGGRRRRPRKGEVVTPWPFPEEPSFRLQRGGGTPGSAMMTGRKTERGQGGEEQRAAGTDRRCRSLLNHRDGDPPASHIPRSRPQRGRDPGSGKAAPNRGHSPRSWDARGQAEPLLDAEETWGTGWTRSCLPGRAGKSQEPPGDFRGLAQGQGGCGRVWDTPTRAGFRVRTVR